MTIINELSPPEDLENWAYENFWNVLDAIPDTADFSDLQLALLGVRAIRRSIRRWSPEKLNYDKYLEMVLREEFTKEAADGNYLTVAEKALNLVNGGN